MIREYVPQSISSDVDKKLYCRLSLLTQRYKWVHNPTCITMLKALSCFKNKAFCITVPCIVFIASHCIVLHCIALYDLYCTVLYRIVWVTAKCSRNLTNCYVALRWISIPTRGRVGILVALRFRNQKPDRVCGLGPRAKGNRF